MLTTAVPVCVPLLPVHCSESVTVCVVLGEVTCTGEPEIVPLHPGIAVVAEAVQVTVPVNPEVDQLTLKFWLSPTLPGAVTVTVGSGGGEPPVRSATTPETGSIATALSVLLAMSDVD